MRAIILLGVLALCAVCFAVGFLLGADNRGRAAAYLDEVMPSRRPATEGELNAIRQQISEMDQREEVLATVETNFILLVQSNFYEDEKAINNHASIIQQLQSRQKSAIKNEKPAEILANH